MVKEKVSGIKNKADMNSNSYWRRGELVGGLSESHT
jgi:hypothetical protein